MKSIRVVVADDQTAVREGLAVLLDLLDDVTVVGTAADGEQAVRLATEQQADVVLMDPRMPGCDGVTATERLIAAHGRMPALLAAIAARLGIDTGAAVTLGPKEAAWVDAAAASLARHRGRALLTLGAHHPPELQHLALSIDARLNGHAIAELVARPDPQPETLAALAHDIMGGNFRLRVAQPRQRRLFFRHSGVMQHHDIHRTPVTLVEIRRGDEMRCEF